MSDIHTTLPGKIVAWDGELATVQPTLPKKLADGTTLNAPQIVSVPVGFLVGMGGDAIISVPLQAGDPLKLNFSDRSLENWLSGSDGAPDDPRQHDLSDCLASTVARPSVCKCDTENLSISFGGGSIKIAPNGEITINTQKLTINGETVINGTTTIKGDTATIGGLTNNGTNVGSGHTHSGVLPGPSNTGGPS